MTFSVADLKRKFTSKHRSEIEFKFEIEVEVGVVFEFMVKFNYYFFLKMQT